MIVSNGRPKSTFLVHYFSCDSKVDSIKDIYIYMYGKHVHTYKEYTDSVEWEKKDWGHRKRPPRLWAKDRWRKPVANPERRRPSRWLAPDIGRSETIMHAGPDR